ncbi:putative phosphoglucomutase (alpha-D-glucose-1,6-bisphosphate-dependent) [Medicago truncatula]|uniref:Putative phosphoglucomutase (Alpha-D-glucose-1,6-bisphosphate-dependent) n=1 Tax=Medicago truncatula TaxID=3880 RepID=A0A396K195_MEDTR|nr:putative phosphoglucomutase (alpha-D-glucose-1,6-bisphosphate-dependent) [Medicago truncatula]
MECWCWEVMVDTLIEKLHRAVLAWISIIAHHNKDTKPGEKLISVFDVVKEHWATYGRNFFSRYDYEECESEGANKMIEYLRECLSKSKPGDKYGSYVLQFADDFTYTDPVDRSVVSKQGVRFVFTDGSRIIYRLSAQRFFNFFFFIFFFIKN